MGASRPFFMNPVPDFSLARASNRSTLATVYEKERTLEREISGKVEEALPGVEVLAVELTGPERLTVYVDREGRAVDIELCEQVTRVLTEYLRQYGIDVSSPGPERPLRKPEHFQRALGRRVRVKTQGRKLRGEVTRAGENSVTVAADGGEIDIPYGEIMRGNLIEEKEGR
jgi:ribosome maturation factor RimP